MKRLAECTGHDENDKVPMKKEKREVLVACVTDLLKKENDEQVLESIVELVQDLGTNVGTREALKNFRKNGWGFILKTKKLENDFNVEETFTPTPVSVLEQLNPKLESRLDQETHPMHNELILKKIFEFSSVNDLKNCRLVSTKWRDVSLSSWREKAVLQLDFLLMDADIHDEYVEALVQLETNFREAPFKRYKFQSLPGILQQKIKIKMMDTLSSSLQYFYLNCDNMETISLALSKLPELRAITLQFSPEKLLEQYQSAILDGRKCSFQNLQSATSKLSKLELRLSITTRFESELNFPWKEMFDNIPALKSLRVTYELLNIGGDMHMVTLEEIMQAVCEVRKKGNFSILNLEELDVVDTQNPFHSYPLTEDEVTNIVESKLPLERLSIDLGTNSNPSTILNLLEAHAETLQYMKCDIGPNTEYLKKNVLKLPLAPYLPTTVLLSKLKELVLVSDCVWAFHVLASLDTPNLEKLRIELRMFLNKGHWNRNEELDLKRMILPKSKSGKSPGTFFGASFLPNLNKFFYDGPRNFTTLELQDLAKAMPNLTDICISLGDKTFPVVYKLWPRLQSLHLLASDRTYLLFDDYTVTGLPIDDDNDDISAESREPNITDLKDLRKFVLETKFEENVTRPRKALITNLSAIYGFLQLPKLNFLEIGTSCKFSPNVMAALVKHVSEIKIRKPKVFKDGRETSDGESGEAVSSEDDDESDSEGSNSSMG